ncbi:MAG: hypothetical protein HY958_11230 [Bacteroidia bacterium]|nr:hypothetical protein [Bacteroidia bacterium]
MSQINENLIKKVFDEMTKHRPAMQKHLVTDEEEEDIMDYRVLGDLIIKNYPWPVGVELRRLFSGSMRQLDRMRLDQIFKTIERSIQFISFVMISQAWRDIENGQFKVPDGMKNDFESRFSVLSMGTYTWLIRMLGTAYEEQKIEWFMPEMNTNFDKKFYAALDFWVPERNEIGHYQINLTHEEIEKRCVEYEEKLSFILERLAFLAKYRLVSVNEIKVKKHKKQDARFKHTIGLLNSSDSDFKANEIVESKYADSHCVLFLRSLKSFDDFLNLSPLIIDTHSETIDAKEKFDIKKDVFLYTKFRGDQIMYVGTEVTEKCDLRSLSNYSVLVNEFKELISVMTK